MPARRPGVVGRRSALGHAENLLVLVAGGTAPQTEAGPPILAAPMYGRSTSGTVTDPSASW